MASTSFIPPKLNRWDATVNSDRQLIPVAPYSHVTLQINVVSKSAGIAPVFVIQRSNDGVNWVDTAPATKMDGDTISGVIETRATMFLSIKSDMSSGTVTTYLVDVIVCGDE